MLKDGDLKYMYCQETQDCQIQQSFRLALPILHYKIFYSTKYFEHNQYFKGVMPCSNTNQDVNCTIYIKHPIK